MALVAEGFIAILGTGIKALTCVTSSMPPSRRPWLFRSARNSALDFLRRFDKRNVDMLADLETAADNMASSE